MDHVFAPKNTIQGELCGRYIIEASAKTVLKCPRDYGAPLYFHLAAFELQPTPQQCWPTSTFIATLVLAARYCLISSFVYTMCNIFVRIARKSI